MRLTAEESAAIKSAAAQAFGSGAVVRLFGSRVHDHLRGGDIDLRVEWGGENDWDARIDTLVGLDDIAVMAFFKRYEKYADCLNRILKTISQIMELGKFERLTSVDVARRAEKFGIVDEQPWGDAVRARNALVHEYPLRPDKRAEQVNRAWDARDTLETWRGILRFVEQERLTNVC